MLDREQEELLAELVHAARKVPREERSFLFTPAMGVQRIRGPGGYSREVRQSNMLREDLAALATHRFVTGGVVGRRGGAFNVTAEGHAHFDAVMQARGEPMKRQEEELRRLLDSDAFGSGYPNAYARWSDAERLLWAADTEREFTTVGHKCREAMQEFATEVVARYDPPNVDSNPSLVNRRLGGTIAMFLPTLGSARAALLRALGDYSEAVMGAVQRQEHGGQKEGHPLTWMDARRVVFHTASVMYEFAVSFDEADSDVPPPATLEPA